MHNCNQETPKCQIVVASNKKKSLLDRSHYVASYKRSLAEHRPGLSHILGSIHIGFEPILCTPGCHCHQKDCQLLPLVQRLCKEYYLAPTLEPCGVESSVKM